MQRDAAGEAVVNGQLTGVVAVHVADEVPVDGIASQLLLSHVIQLHAFQPRPTSVAQNLDTRTHDVL